MREKEARRTQTNSSASSQAPELMHRQPASAHESEGVQDVDAADAQLQREFDKRSSAEQAAALNLVHFAQAPMNADLNINADKIGILIDMLIVSIKCSPAFPPRRHLSGANPLTGRSSA